MIADPATAAACCRESAHVAPVIAMSPGNLGDVSAPLLRRGLNSLSSVGAAMAVSARQVSRTRILVAAIAAAMLVTIVVLVPLPTAVQMRDWATSVGPWFPLAFFGAHIAATVLPFPRTAFTLSAGLLFGPALGISIAVTASTISALIALLLVRAFGWQISSQVRRPAIESLDARLRDRGWPAVLALRLIPAVPFSVLNYAAGASAVRVVPYLLATLVGLLPGTSAAVILGDALTGDVNPLLVLVSTCIAAVGIAGLIYETRRYRRDMDSAPQRSVH